MLRARWRWLRAGMALGCCAAAMALPIQAARSSAPRPEIRALWVVRTSLTSPQSIATLVDTAKHQGINTLIVQVRGRGDAYYRSTIEPRADALKDQPAEFDPLAQVTALAHRAGVRVHAWLNTFLLANLDDLPTSSQHAFVRHPEWLMVPRQVAADLYALSPTARAYVDRIVQWSKTDLAELEGIYLSPAHPEVRRYLQEVWMDLVNRYDVDGVHFDYVRYPNANFDFSRTSLDAFDSTIESSITPAERKAIGYAVQQNPLALTNLYPGRWADFEREQVTTLVRDVSRAVKRRKPSLLVSAAVFADDQDAFAQRFQDWRRWLDEGLLDIVCPMAYTPDTDLFKRQIALAKGFSAGHEVWAGVGAYRQTPESTAEKIRVARRLGAGGFVLFSYDSMTQPSLWAPPGDYLIQLNRLLTVSSPMSGIAVRNPSR